MTAEDWYPRDAEGQAQFQEKLAANLPQVAAKYGVAAEMTAQVAANAVWLRYWVDYRAGFALESEQLTRYYNAKALGKNADGEITAPIFTIPKNMPPEIEGDVRTFTFILRKEIVNKSNFSAADGELLGFTRPDFVKKPDNEITPIFKLRMMTDFNLEATFSKQGMDAISFEVRHRGSDWKPAATLTTSPGDFRVEPIDPADAEQVEVRAILLRKNQPVGSYSAIQTALVAP